MAMPMASTWAWVGALPLAEQGENEGLRNEADGRGGEEGQRADGGEAGGEVEQDIAADRHQAEREGGDERPGGEG